MISFFSFPPNNFFFPSNFFLDYSHETWYYLGFQGLQVYWHCPFLRAIQTHDIAAILIL